jgi:hypothetical protein
VGRLHIGPRFGALAFAEIFVAFWMSSAPGAGAGSVGFAFTWDSPLPH